VRLLPPESAAAAAPSPVPGAPGESSLGYCVHKIFGRGKKIRFMPPDRFLVNFPGFGIKTILADFLAPAE
jgi:DNA helicase-2/ATP-dependent DNA helicase PcrA